LEAFSLYEVNQYVKRVLALNFEEPFWVECELNSVSNSRGNIYLDLIEKAEDSDEIIARNSGNIWYRQFLFIKKKLGALVDSILQDGTKVKLKVNITYSERYGLSLNIEDIDPAYTFGQFEMNRQKTIEQLKSKRLMEKNAKRKLPRILQHIAVISSKTAAGYQDFVQQLKENPYGYCYKVSLLQSAMQGPKTEREVVKAIELAQSEGYDMIAIIRGGGSKLDLAAFDNYNIATAIAHSLVPVVTGIGHDIDLSVSDMVAHTVLKTPTAVADWLVEHNSVFESEIISLESDIFFEVQELIRSHRDELLLIEEKLQTVPYHTLALHEQMLDNLDDTIDRLGYTLLEKEAYKLEAAEDLLHVLSPEQVLSRGYALVKQNDTYRTTKASITKSPAELELIFSDGILNVNQN